MSHHFFLLGDIQTALKDDVVSIFRIISDILLQCSLLPTVDPYRREETEQNQSMFYPFTVLLLMAALFWWMQNEGLENAKNIQRLSQEGSTHKARVAAMWKWNTLSLKGKFREERCSCLQTPVRSIFSSCVTVEDWKGVLIKILPATWC